MAESLTLEQWESVLDTTVEMSTNSSVDPPAEEYGKFTFNDVITILSLVIALVGLVGNGIVLWLLGIRTQRSPFSVYILNLAAADALFLGSYFGFLMWRIFEDLYNVVREMLLLCMVILSYCVGLSLLAAISTERCLSVLFPLWYRCHRPKHTSAAVCAILWALPSLISGAILAPYFFGNDHIFDALYRALPFIMFWWFVLLTCVLGASSLTLVLRVQCSSQRRRPPRLYLLVLLTVLVFLLCGLPLGVIDAIWFFGRIILMPFELSWLLACVNSSANPFIYFFLGSQRHRRGRESLRVVLQRALGEEPVMVGVKVKDTSHPKTLDKLF